MNPDSPKFLASLWREHRLWFGAWLLWFGCLWWLSGRPPQIENGPEIPHFDKVLHFGYFFGGAGLLSAALWLRFSIMNFWAFFFMVWPWLLGVGALDEWHQSWHPLRSGNNLGDWIADALGSGVGVSVFWCCRRQFSSLLLKIRHTHV